MKGQGSFSLLLWVGLSNCSRQYLKSTPAPATRQLMKIQKSLLDAKRMAPSHRRHQFETARRCLGQPQADIDPGFLGKLAVDRFRGVQRARFRQLVDWRTAAAISEILALARTALDAALNTCIGGGKTRIVEQLGERAASL